jgi:hypothetical protein
MSCPLSETDNLADCTIDWGVVAMGSVMAVKC